MATSAHVQTNRSRTKRKQYIPQTRSLKCPECNKVFQRAFTFERHYSAFHEPTTKKYVCKSCDKLFTRKDSLVSHKKACEKGKHKDKCPICDFTGSKNALRQHYQSDHGISLKKEVIECCSVEEFNDWKNQYEKENIAKYIKITTYARSDLSHVTFYACHRNGYYWRGEGPRVRRSKIQGTNKICGWCPSEMKVVCHKEGRVTATYFSTHVGHEKDIERIPLNKEEKDEIAQKLAAKVPPVRILSDVQYGVAKSNHLNRIHVLSRQDLENIKLAYKIKENANDELNTSASDSGSLMSIDSKLIESMIRFKKDIGRLSEQYPKIDSGDFVLVIMSDGQIELLKQFGKRCVCIDHVSTKTSFKLITLYILNDENQTLLPCAFLYTSSINTNTLTVFFSEVRNNVFCIKSNIFLSDLNDIYYQVWCDVMSMPKCRYYSSLHVWRAWRKRLVMTCHSEEYKKILNSNLRVILEETDADKFKANLSEFISDLYNNEFTENFAVFFESIFTKTCELWAYCFRNQDAISVDIQLERVNTSIQYLCKQDKGDDQFKNFMVSIAKFLHFTIAQWIGIKDKKYRDLKLLNIKKTHREAFLEKDMEIHKLNDVWCLIVKSKRYIIKTASTQCECDIRCEQCTACIHAFYCTCVDSKLRWNMCKHIHYFCSKVLFEHEESDADDVSKNVLESDQFLNGDHSDESENGKTNISNDICINSITTNNNDKMLNDEDIDEDVVYDGTEDFEYNLDSDDYITEQIEDTDLSKHCSLDHVKYVKDVASQPKNERDFNCELETNHNRFKTTISTEVEDDSQHIDIRLQLKKESSLNYFCEILKNVTSDRQLKYINETLLKISEQLKNDT